uniref:Aquaporin NIP4-1 n=1 Tax=Nicotiana sylvestris TaxID=4096 RepID=A0A1U7XDD6_NICSY
STCTLDVSPNLESITYFIDQFVADFHICRPITGASMNPARSLGPAIVSGVYKNQWIFVIAPILGAMTATGIYSLLRQPKQEMLMSKALQSI